MDVMSNIVAADSRMLDIKHRTSDSVFKQNFTVIRKV
jgi:hypothetical protein